MNEQHFHCQKPFGGRFWTDMAFISAGATIMLLIIILGIALPDSFFLAAMGFFFIICFLILAWVIVRRAKRQKGHIVIDDEKVVFYNCLLSKKEQEIFLLKDINRVIPDFHRGRWNLVVQCENGRTETIDGQQFSTKDLSWIHVILLGLDPSQQPFLQKNMDDKIRSRRTVGIIIIVVAIIIRNVIRLIQYS